MEQHQRIKTLIDKNTDRENSTQSNNPSRVGDQVLVRSNQGSKYETPYKGEYTSIKTCTNGAVIMYPRQDETS